MIITLAYPWNIRNINGIVYKFLNHKITWCSSYLLICQTWDIFGAKTEFNRVLRNSAWAGLEGSNFDCSVELIFCTKKIFSSKETLISN